ncbi:tRNA dimethylallyltransferase [Thiohalospira halophila DSM 15071]|uniref:tRNA dimethylallyltransferase n=2 Tax=Thiohalospira halophila TaxID=381300 RepID=A0A1I1UMM2_9GAMM|nr:tRNA dimethylallyltransferase [Thiohalospira halophila DSM 15071]
MTASSGSPGSVGRQAWQTDPALRPLFLMGPTASGKTGLAVELVRRGVGAIISVDSAQVYRGLDVGTAKPDAATLAEAPHRLLDIRDPAEGYSAAEFRRDALAAMDEVAAAGQRPLLVGGTMLYFRALLHGLDPLPPGDPEVRQRLEAEAAEQGWGALHARLAAADPESGRRIHPNDPQRIQRALEILETTGRPPSAWYAENAAEPLPVTPIKIAVAPGERSELHRRIEARFHAMLEAGLEEEVAALRSRGNLGPEHPVLRMVGYRQVLAYLEGEVDHSTMVEQGVAATRQLARRQLTWLRREPDVHWLDPEAGDAVERALKWMAADATP